ncbi:VanZ family protein [Mucilaginibacter rigui]|uniref:VanZ family protein n=1 Tax=Mucilaginibacter rigui TaxID=534635 RepID=A0ABR7X4E8_9SPHI|nr:VanZ family protein [Mucilaginibacter rigui]MBD1385446.1 VanZ family protein [Mucilaginibacter rigui]
MKQTLKYYGPAILWALFILIICAVPFSAPGPPDLFFPGFDKLVHCVLFFVLSVLYCYGSIRKWQTRSIRIAIAMKNTVVLISYGALIEYLQMRVFTWRSGDWNDLLADTIGSCMGIFGVLLTSNAINHENS